MMHTALTADGQHKLLEHVDPDLIDNALADLEIARTFLDATDKYFDELNEWLKPTGFAPNRALHAETHKGQTIMLEADNRIGLAQGRLRTALSQAFSAKPSLPTSAAASRFAAAMDKYRMAYLAGQAFHLLNDPGPGGDYTEFEPAFDEYCLAAVEAEKEVLLTPATSVADMLNKQAVIDQQESYNRTGDDTELYMRQLVADAIALAGGAA